MTALVLIAAALFGGLCWAGRRSRPATSDQTITACDVDAVGGDIASDDACTSDSDDIACAADDYQSDTSESCDD